MRKFSLHLGFILPLFIVCASFLLLQIGRESLAAYERALSRDYSVIITAKTPIVLGDLGAISEAKELKEISPNEVLNRLKGQLSAANIKALSKILPRFYSLGFSKFMSESEITQIKNTLEKMPQITRAEVFLQTHTKVYHLLLLLKTFLLIFSVIAALLCWILFAKQLRIWRYEHAERVYVLELFGAPFFIRCGFMLRAALADCIIVYLLLLAAFAQFFDYPFVRDFYAFLHAPLPQINIFAQLGIIVCAAFFASCAAVVLVLKKK